MCVSVCLFGSFCIDLFSQNNCSSPKLHVCLYRVCICVQRDSEKVPREASVHVTGWKLFSPLLSSVGVCKETSMVSCDQLETVGFFNSMCVCVCVCMWRETERECVCRERERESAKEKRGERILSRN